MIDELHLSTIKGTYKGDTSFNSLDLTSFKQIKSIDFKDFKYNLYIKTVVINKQLCYITYVIITKWRII